jgi:hypothetical protein
MPLKILSGFAKGNRGENGQALGCFELYHNKEVKIKGRTYPELSFASPVGPERLCRFLFFSRIRE